MDPAQIFMNKIEKLQEPMNAVIGKGDSPIQSWYEGSVAFITGGNGFLGKLLIEKLLRACNMKKIYILLRGKKNKTMMERMDIMIHDPIFDTLRAIKPEELSKIAPIEGDVANLALGIKVSDWNILIEEVDIIFHLAATTRFDETLRVATNVNVRGTREVLALAKSCKKLRLFNHISTAYSHTTSEKADGEVLEIFYKAPISPEALIKMSETMSERKLEAITGALIEGWPNTYSFTKAVAEDLVKEMEEELPICVMRPSIVQASYYEPAPGWMDNSVLFGAAGVTIGIGQGVLHVFYGNNNIRLSYVPGDYVTNATIAASWNTAMRWKEGLKDIKIYTISSTKCDFKLDTIVRIFRDRNTKRLHTPKALWYCFCVTTNNKFVFLVSTWFLHFIPAYIMDGIFHVFKIQMPPGIRSFAGIYNKIYKLNLALSYFVAHDWSLRDDNTADLYKTLSAEDKAIFNCEVSDVDWKEYYLTICMGIRKYIVKDGLKDSAYACRKQKLLGVANFIFFTIYLYVIYLFLSFVFLCVTILFKDLKCLFNYL